MHRKTIVQIGDKSVFEGSNTNFLEKARRLEQRNFARIISIMWAE